MSSELNQSTYNLSQYFYLLNQQVMSPVSNGSRFLIKLTEDNFENWRIGLSDTFSVIRIELYEYFERNGVVTTIPAEVQADAVLNQSVLKLLDNAIKTAIITSSEPSMQDVIRKYMSKHLNQTSMQIMNFLKVNYGTAKVDNTAKLFNQIKDMFNKSLEEQAEWAGKILDVIKSQLFEAQSATYETEEAKEEGILMAQDHLEAMILMALNPSYQATCLNFLGRTDKITTKDVISLISNNIGANKTTMIANPKSNQKGKKSKKHCQVCNENHYLNECPEFKKAFPNAPVIKKYLNNQTTKGSANNTAQKTESGWIAATNNNIKHDDWIFDSGSTVHICNDRSKFETFESKEGSQISGVAGNVSIEGYGKVVTDLQTFHNVAYVPSLPFNLISISAASKRGEVGFSFVDGNVLAISDGSFEQVGYAVDDLYVMGTPARSLVNSSTYSFLSAEQLLPAPTTVKEVPRLSGASLMHARLGHPSVGLYNRIAPIIGQPTMNPEHYTICPSCSISKGTMHKGKVSQTSYEHVLELIQVDLCGNFRYNGFEDNKYFMTIRDAASRFYSVIHLKSKSAATDKLIDWIVKMEKQFIHRGLKVLKIRTDNGGEFVNGTFHEFCRSHGIEHQLTVPHNSFQNGAVERAHRSILDKARTLLVSGGVPPSLWTEAVSCAVYLLNRLPVPNKHNMIPYCKWYDYDPTTLRLKHLRPFGCLAFTTLPPTQRDGKFAPTAIVAVMVGYERSRKAYRLYHPESQTIFSSNQVRFDEQRYPLLDSPTTDISHKFATSTLGGVPSYPKSGATITLPTSHSGSGSGNSLPPPANVDLPQTAQSEGSITDDDTNDLNSSLNSTSTDFPADSNLFEISGGSTSSRDSVHSDISTGNSMSITSSEPEESSHHSDPDFRPSNALQRYAPPPDNEYQLMENRVRELEQQLQLQRTSAASDLERLTSNNIALQHQLDALREHPSIEQDSSYPSSGEYEQLQTQVQDIQNQIHNLSASNAMEAESHQQEANQYQALARPHLVRHSREDSSISGQVLSDIDGVRAVKARRLDQDDPTAHNVHRTSFEASTGESMNYLEDTRNNQVITTEDALQQFGSSSSSSFLPPVPVGQQAFPDPSFLRILPQSFVPASTGSPITDNQLLQICSSADDTSPSPDSSSSLSIHPVLTAMLVAQQVYAAQLPKTFQQAMAHPDSAAWKVACDRELAAFRSHNTYELVPPPSDRRPLGARWVFTEKSNNLKKARLVAQGYAQKEGIDYEETFAPVIRYDSVRFFLALTASLKLQIHQMDVDTAFLNSDIDTEVYVRQPPGYINGEHPDYVWKLKGGMYGLKQAPLLWNTHMNDTLLSFGFTRHPGEYGLYFQKSCDGLVLVALYVDDLLIATPSVQMMKLMKALLSSSYSMKDLGPVNKFLGMTINQSSDAITLDLSDYITSAAHTAQIDMSKKVYIPLSKSVDLFGDDSPLLTNVTPYQSLVGQLLFAANAGRPDISFAISTLSRFLKSPRKIHLAAAERLFQYLYTTRHYCLRYEIGHPISLNIFTDASTPSKDDLPFSTGGYVTTMSGGTVTWSSRKITSTVCLSSTEAEYIAASEAVKETEWLVNLLDYMELKIDTPKIYIDCQPALQLAKNPVFHSRAKHIPLHYHKIRFEAAKGKLILEKIGTNDQPADMMTKALARDKVEYFAGKIMDTNSRLRGIC